MGFRAMSRREKFYKFTHQDYLATLQLKPAEKDLLFYIRTIDPFNDGCEFKISEVAEVIGRNKGTISRALRELGKRGFINMEIVSVRVKVTPAIADELPPNGSPEKPPEEPPEQFREVVPTQLELSPHNLDDPHTTFETPTQLSEPPHNFGDPEPAPDKPSKPSKTYSDYLRLLQTLSDEAQRERFLNFCHRKASQLPQPVQMIDKWIFKNFDFLKAQFQEETGERINTGENAGTKTSSVNDQGSASCKPKNKKISLASEMVELLEAAIATNEIQDYRYCEPLKRWMVLFNGSQVEIEYWLERREAIANE